MAPTGYRVGTQLKLARKPLSLAPLRIFALVAGALGAATFAGAARGDESGITLFGGWRSSGSFEDTVAGRKVRLRDTAAWSAAFDFGIDPERQVELFVSRQSTSLSATEVGGTATLRFPIKVAYLHIGGTNYFAGPAGSGPFVAGGIGVTRMSPDLDGFESATRPSLSLSLGYSVPLGRAVALRVEGRGYWTAINSSGGLFCAGGGCTVSLKADALRQYELMAGISARF